MKNSEKFESYLNQKRCFKLICGAGNSDLNEITKLCALYASSGCRFFDVSASPSAISAAKKGFELAKKENDCFLCISVGTKNDPHLSKYKINKNKCTNCEKCSEICPQSAIKNGIIIEEKCIGCGQCFNVCSGSAIEQYSKYVPLTEILPPLIEKDIDCIEYHIITDNEEEVIQGFKTITSLYDGAVSVCLDRSKWGNEKIIDVLSVLKNLSKNIFIVQADGAPMSGGKDDFRTTLQTVATADIIEKANISPYIFLSGGTNSKTFELANLCAVPVCGIAAGSYARKIVKEYIDRDDFLNNKNVFAQALKIAENFVSI